MLKTLTERIKQLSMDEAKDVVRKEVKKTINETKEKIKTETDKMVRGDNGKMLIFAAIGISVLAAGIAIFGQKTSNPIVVNIYTAR